MHNTIEWIKACAVGDVPEDGGACVQYGNDQIAVYHAASRGEWYATQNMCPHRNQMALSRGLIGDANGEPKIACPFHKKTFSLATGCNLDGENYSIRIYPVKVSDGAVYIGVPVRRSDGALHG
jgi:nitrite reductase (NADH) small subunit